MALVCARPSASQTRTPSTPATKSDPELARAKDLVELHFAVKVAHQDGRLEGELAEARDAVRRALGQMG